MSDLILALDTATEHVTVALGHRDGPAVTHVASKDFEAPRAALGVLIPTALELLSECGADVSALCEVVVGRGPGSFTGVRIGVSSAKGLAQGLGVPLHGVSTLDAIAWRHVAVRGLVGVIGDAMRGEVYPALFRVTDRGIERVGGDRVSSPERAADEWAALGETVTLAGNGLRKYAEVFASAMGASAVMTPVELWTPSGAGLLAAYAAALVSGTSGDGDVAALLPVYTRLSDAEESERERLGTGVGGLPASGVSGPEGEVAR